MTHVFVANYCDRAFQEAELDDPTYAEDLRDMACPRFSSVSLALSPEWVKKVTDQVLADLKDSLEEEEEFTVGPMEECIPPSGRRSWMARIKFAHTTEVAAMIVIQQTELEG